MPDISMCMDKHCTLRHDCYRYTAMANEPQQSYGGFKQVNDKCDYFWDNERKNCKGVKRVGEGCNFNNNCSYPNCNLK